MLMISFLANVTALNLTIPSTTEGKIVLGLTWAATLLVAIMLFTALLPLLLRRPPPGDGNEGQAPAWFRLFFAATCIGLGQAVMAIVWVFFQSNSFSQSNLSAQYTPRGVVLIVALAGLLALFYDSSSNSAPRLARGQARLRGPFETPIIGLLTPTEERICTAYGRMNGRIWLLVPFQILLTVGIILLSRKGLYLDTWPLIMPFLLCWFFALVAFLIVSAALLRLNRRSLSAYCQELAALGRKWVDAVDGELRLEGLGLYQRLADLADAVGKERLLQQGSVEATEAVAEARLVLAQASLEPGGEGVKDATQYLVGAVDLRDLKRGEWLGLGWLLASDYVPESLVKERARYGHFLLSYCRAWIAAQRQLQQKTPLSAAMKTNVRLSLVVSALERRVCALVPDTAGQQQAEAGEASSAVKGEKAVPWRADTFLADLAARPDVQLLLALNEAVVQLDGALSWARVNAGLCRLAVGDAALARAHLEIAATQRRDDPTLPFYRAVAYAREQQSSEALALLEEVTARELGWFLVVRTYAETLLEVFQTPLVSTSTAAPVSAISAERWKRARAIIESALLEEEMQAKLQLPSAAPIYIAAGMTELFEHRQPAQADVWFRRALGVNRQNAQAWYGLALASWEHGSIDAALNAAQEAMRYQSPHVPAATLCAQILMVRGEMVPALAMAEQTLQLLNNPAVAQMRVVHHPRLSPERDVLLRVKGRAAFELGRFAEAFAALDQVVRRYIDARFFAACALFHLGRYAEATERLKDYLASKEGAQDSRGYLYLGCALHAQGPQNLRAALNALDACLAGAHAGSPERLRALLERGQIYEERGQLEQAQRDYEAALEIERAPLTSYVLAALYHRSGRDQEAYDLLATVTGDAQSVSAQQSEALPGVEAGSGAQSPSVNTLVFMQPNEPVEVQIRRLMEILRQRLEERATRQAEEQARQAVLKDETPAAAKEPVAAAEASDTVEDTASPPAESLTAPRKAKRTATKPKSGAKKAVSVEQDNDDMPTLSVEGVQAQVKRGNPDDGPREE